MEKILCISTANIATARENSASSKAALIAKRLIKEFESGIEEKVEVDILELYDYDLTPCKMCEKCFPENNCVENHELAEILGMISDSDGIIVIVPHYALVPSKLLILLEKMEEISYLNYCKKTEYKIPTQGKSVAIIGHGGLESGFETFYKENLLLPLSNVFENIGAEVIHIKDQPGVLFGIKGFKDKEGVIAPGIEHNWEQIEDAISPLIKKLVDSI